MLTDPATRKRYPAQATNPPQIVGGVQTVTPGLAEISGGIWGTPNPLTADITEQLSAVMGPYHYHQGDIFLPGPAAWALDPSHDTPLETVWGHAFLVRANAFRPFAAEGFIGFTAPVQPLVGVGGYVSGQMAFQPLQVRQADGG